MPSLRKSAKQLQIDKTNAAIVLWVSIAAVVTAFSLVGVKTLLSQRAYQSRVISQQETALKVAKADVTAVQQLQTSYNAFNNSSTNLLGGLTTGSGERDGTNAKLVLDSLPSQYDFPALVSSLEKLLKERGFKVDTLSGSDDITQADVPATNAPTPIEIPFQVGVSGTYTSVQDLVGVFEHSIRPFAINSLQISGSDSNVSLAISAKTYYQPGKTLNITKKVVK